MDTESDSDDRHSSIHVANGIASQRLTAWQRLFSLSGRILIPDTDVATFEGQFESVRFGELMAIRITSSPFSFVRDAAYVATVKRDMVMINLVETGGQRGIIAGRTINLETGDLVLSRYASTMTIDNMTGTWFGLLVPRRLMEPYLPWKRSLDGRVYAALSATALILGSHMRTLLSLSQEMTDAEVSQVERATLAVVIAQLGGKALQSESHVQTDDDIMGSVRRFIMRRVRDPDLDPAMICRELSLSRSHLYRIGNGGDGIASMIRETRLRGIYRDIVSRRFAQQSLSAIATRWGLSDPRSFRRAFARRFGLSPSDLRSRIIAIPDTSTECIRSDLAAFDEWFEAYK